ncbi:hypothetical protein MTR62_09665 [Novosphingobium sp. 1949]|uniref:YCII-related domain-containing protein n=1 Tax=Novosphingobium organovorum TaxID=2930092 RepID=A0ABT0BD49_9SPHN|nr:hypothetical protein [Novosphingobium organovorum]MCJ2182957.1 hypothetical protein [Novosphingobium organovorum]
MLKKHATRPVSALKVYCPIDAATQALLARGAVMSIDPDCALARLIAFVRDENPLGDFGPYQSVMELATGLELFTPGAAARPTLGEAGAEAVSATAIVTIYIPADAPQAAVSAAIDEIVALHPWEVPVIELVETRLVTRV